MMTDNRDDESEEVELSPLEEHAAALGIELAAPDTVQPDLFGDDRPAITIIRTKPTRVVYLPIEQDGEPVPMVICAWCQNGPLMRSDGDHCCTLTEAPQ